MKFIIQLMTIFFLVSLTIVESSFAEPLVIRVGSKNFTESYILAEIMAQQLEKEGLAKVERRYGMNGTGILFQSLAAGEIDVYPEYTGTISHVILQDPTMKDPEKVQKALGLKRAYAGKTLGFNNSYGLAVTKALSKKLNLKKISDLKNHPNLRMAFSYEFMEREDGYPSLIKKYGLKPKSPSRMDHSLVYAALDGDKADVIELYTTDPKIKKYDLLVLEDDQDFFPRYEGLFLFNKSFADKHPEIVEKVNELADTIGDQRMIDINGLVELEDKTFAEAASIYFNETLNKKRNAYWRKFIAPTKRHLLLVFIPLLVSILIGVPLGILASKVKVLGQFVLMTVGLVQTIPSLALLCFLIPIFGIGLIPSLIALILYGLLPIVRNTYSGFQSIEPRYHEICSVLGLPPSQKLFRIELPLASISILGGIKTSAVISVGMATLAAFIGAGGYGAMIVTGLALNNNNIILEGALPAALMAVAVHFLFELTDYFLVPKGLKR